MEETLVTPAPVLKAPRKKRKWVKRLIILALVAAVIIFILLKMGSAGNQLISSAYIPATAQVQDLTVSVSSTGTVQPIDSYKVTALVKGEVLEAPFEVGDIVTKDNLLYRIDGKDVENSIARSEIGVAQSRLAYNDMVKNKGDAQKNLDIQAPATGVVEKLYYDQGDTAAAGAPIADVLDRETMILTVPFHAADGAGFYKGQSATIHVGGSYETLSGIVDAVAPTDTVGQGGTLVRNVDLRVTNPGALSDQSSGTATIGTADCAAAGTFAYGAKKTVTAKTSGKIISLTVKEGDRVTKDQLLGAFESTNMDSQVENARLSLRNAELGLQSTRDQLESYTITSPISGTVIEKNFKAGDNIDPSTAGATYLALIYDMSTLTFDMNIDELDIGKIKVGQEVQITAEALQGKTFTGVVDKINISGNTVNGYTSYPVTVVIDDPRDLLPGMNISAKIMIEQIPQVLCVPVEAVARGNEVTVALPGALTPDGKQVADITKLETRTVTLGRNDEMNIEITDGLQAGDV
ncbi:MAG: efflux RND transporter periplasmic adaptor subunit, partial [Pseudoflavonifractor sp.]